MQAEQVRVEITVENLADVRAVRDGRLPPGQARRLVMVAQVDPGAMVLSLPAWAIRQLGLEQVGVRSAGAVTGPVYDPVELVVLGRECAAEVTAVPASCPAIVGRLPLLALDLVVDMRNRRLIGNPEHNGDFIIDMF